jgi:hypothetical protein
MSNPCHDLKFKDQSGLAYMCLFNPFDPQTWEDDPNWASFLGMAWSQQDSHGMSWHKWGRLGSMVVTFLGEAIWWQVWVLDGWCHRRSLLLRFLEPRFGTIQILLVLVKASHVNPCSSVLWSCCWFSGGSRSSNQNASWPSLQPVTEMEIASRPHQAKYPSLAFSLLIIFQ